MQSFAFNYVQNYTPFDMKVHRPCFMASLFMMKYIDLTSKSVAAPVKSRLSKKSDSLGAFFFFLPSFVVPADPGPMAGFALCKS